MERFAELWRRARFYLRRERFDAELEEEMNAHLDFKVREKIDAGMDPAVARAEARREFGNVLALRERSTSVWSFGGLDATVRDVGFALRTMRRAPVFTVAAVVTLALGVGVNTAAFSVVRAVLLAPLPYPSPNTLVAVSSANSRTGDTSFGVSGADLIDVRRDATSFSGLALFSPTSVSIDDGDRVESIDAARVSDGFFETMGVEPELGRVFSAEEYGPGVRSIVISHDLWLRRFGGDPDVVGKTVPTPRGPLTIVGVMPATFRMPVGIEAWRALDMTSSELQVHSDRYFGAVGRLAPGVDVARAEADLRLGTDRLAATYPDSNADWGMRTKSLRDSMVGDSAPALLVLFVATALVLLIATVNVAHLLLARATARLGEITIRSALGASRGRLVRQLVTENLVLALAGGALGALGALASIRSVVALVPDDLRVERLDETAVDPSVLAFALAVTLAAAVVFGVVVALRGVGGDVSGVSRGVRVSTAGRGMLHLRGALVSAEVALTLVLAVAAGLLLQSLANLGRVDVGLSTERLVSVRVGSSTVRFDDDVRRSALYGDFASAVRAVPGVESVSVSASVPLAFTLIFPYRIEGQTSFGDSPDAAYNPVSPGFFRETKIPLLAGREIEESDRAGARPVAVISDAMRRRHFAGSDPIGRILTVNYRGTETQFEIVGVCGDTKQFDIAAPPMPEIYVSYLQYPWLDTALLVRTSSDPERVIPAIQAAIHSVDRSQSGTYATTYERLMTEKTARARFLAVLLAAFAALALALAAIGVFGVMSYTVIQRTREIGIRIALGAQRTSVTALVVGRGMGLVLLGLVPGAALAFGLARTMESLLFGVSGLEPTVLAGTSALLVLVALCACLAPARRAASVDPITALRQE